MLDRCAYMYMYTNAYGVTTNAFQLGQAGVGRRDHKIGDLS